MVFSRSGTIRSSPGTQRNAGASGSWAWQLRTCGFQISSLRSCECQGWKKQEGDHISREEHDVTNGGQAQTQPERSSIWNPQNTEIGRRGRSDEWGWSTEMGNLGEDEGQVWWGAHSFYLSVLFTLRMDTDQTLPGLMAYVNSNGHIKYSKPMRVTSICNLDIFYFPFDEQNCTLTFSSFVYTGEWESHAEGERKGLRRREQKAWMSEWISLKGVWNLSGKESNSLGKGVGRLGGGWIAWVSFAVEKMVLGMEQDVQAILEISQNIIWNKGEWVLQGIHQMMKMTAGTNGYDQIVFYVSSGALGGIFFYMHSSCPPPECKLSHKKTCSMEAEVAITLFIEKSSIPKTVPGTQEMLIEWILPEEETKLPQQWFTTSMNLHSMSPTPSSAARTIRTFGRTGIFIFIFKKRWWKSYETLS